MEITYAFINNLAKNNYSILLIFYNTFINLLVVEYIADFNIMFGLSDIQNNRTNHKLCSGYCLFEVMYIEKKVF